MDFNSAALFVKVVQYGSFSETARRTNTPVATVSRWIAELEKDLGIRLLERSTRHLRMTQAGTTFYEYAARGFEVFETTELPPFLIKEHLASGRLKTLLEDYSLPTQQLNLLYPSCKQLSRLVSTYIDFCTEWVDCLFQ
ncbi:LysR family transcriptional regulator [Nostoc sp.]